MVILGAPRDRAGSDEFGVAQNQRTALERDGLLINAVREYDGERLGTNREPTD